MGRCPAFIEPFIVGGASPPLALAAVFAYFLSKCSILPLFSWKYTVASTQFEKVRLSLGFSRARLCNEAGITERTLFNLERGKRVRPTTASALFTYLNDAADDAYVFEDFFDLQGRALEEAAQKSPSAEREDMLDPPRQGLLTLLSRDLPPGVRRPSSLTNLADTVVVSGDRVTLTKLKYERVKLNLSQPELARCARISEKTLRTAEQGVPVRMRTATRILSALDELSGTDRTTKLSEFFSRVEDGSASRPPSILPAMLQAKPVENLYAILEEIEGVQQVYGETGNVQIGVNPVSGEIGQIGREGVGYADASSEQTRVGIPEQLQREWVGRIAKATKPRNRPNRSE